MFPKKLKSFLKDYFTLTSRERKGAMALAILIMLQMGIIYYLNYFSLPNEPALEKYKIEILKFEEHIKNQPDKEYHQNNYENKYTFPNTVNLFEFDPNKINDSTWMSFGLSKKQTGIIRNYLKKGGVFRQKSDLSKIYGISEKQFKLLEPYIRIPEKTDLRNVNTPVYSKNKPEFNRISINVADTVEMCKLPMIGPGRARMIFKYRNALGGFVDANQLMEVYTMDSTVLHQILPKISIDLSLVQKFNINADTLRHPYLSKHMVTAIVSFRKQHGKFSKLEDLKKIAIMNDEILSKLAPYVRFE